jgi:hypothetical protein
VRILGVLDGVAVAEDRDRQVDHFGHRLHFPVAADGDFKRDLATIAQYIVRSQRHVMDRPFARGEIEDNHQRAERKNCHATFHVNLQNIRSAVPTGKLSSASQSAPWRKNSPDGARHTYSAASFTAA